MNTRTRVALAVVALVVVAAGIFFAARRDEKPSTTSSVVAEKVTYYCPMHPTVVSDKPGSCPICGMALVKRSTPDTQTAAELAQSGSVGSSISTVALSPEQRVTANVRTMKVTLDTHTGDTVVPGRVTFDERRLAQVTAYTAGRIERMFANFTGDSVRRGEAVASIYSPELFGAQQEYLVALANRSRMQNAGYAGARSAAHDLVASAERRLSLLGMTSGQIRQLARSGKPIVATTIISPVSGVVTRKLAVEQQYVAQGQPLLEIADLSTVWIEADVYEQQLSTLQVGQRATITSAATDAVELPGVVSFIQPVVTGATRTTRVRIELPNKGLQLKPDMFVNVRLYGAPAPPHVMVPAAAVIDRGQRQFVWVERTPGTYEPREVKTGGRHGELVVISSGLVGGETIVVEGGFLLDSEAQLRSATAGAEHAGH